MASWFSSISASGILAEAQKKAEELSTKAREVAAQASVQARVLAEQATAQAKVLAEKAAQETNQLQARLEKLAEGTGGAAAASTSGGNAAQPGAADPAELARYGVSDALLGHVMAGLTYSTFSDTNLDALAASNPLGVAPGCSGPGARLSGWQERHALLVLGRCEQLQHLRFALCPKRMTDTQFWMVYFHHCKHLLPPEAFGLPAAALTPAPTPVPAAQPGTSSSPATSTASAVQAAGVGPSSTPAAAVATPKGAAGAEDSQPTAVTPSQLAAGSTGGSAVQGGAGAEGEGSECGGRSPSSSAAHTEGGAGSGGGAGSACEDDVGGGSGSGCSGDEVDLLGDLEDDPELAAYLQEALDLDEAGGGGSAGGGLDDDDDGELDELGSGGDDLEEYISQLDAELAASSVDTSPCKTPAKA